MWSWWAAGTPILSAAPNILPRPKPAPAFARFAIGKQARNQEARAIIQEKTHQLAVRAALVP